MLSRSQVVRQSFLRRHVAVERDRFDEILPVAAVVRQLEDQGCSVAEADRRRLLDDFFQGDHPDGRLYLPLALKPLVPGTGAVTWPSLTEALRCPVATGSPPGIVLAARTGAGKTLATIQAFRDCIIPQPDPEARTFRPPPLEGWVPVRLRVDEAHIHALADLNRTAARDSDRAMKEADEVATDTIAVALITLAAFGEPSPASRVPGWLDHGPGIIAFIDLNAVGSDISRRAVARSLDVFQGMHKGRHRVVVTYRSTQAEDGTLAALGESHFRRFDLESVHTDQAAGYLRNFREFERSAHERFHRPYEARHVDAEVRKLVEMINKHSKSVESVISTPLAMHLVSILDKEESATVATLADLYRLVTRKLLAEQTSRHRLGPEVTAQSEVALVRVALAIQSQGAQATHLSSTADFRRVLGQPETFRRSVTMRWLPGERSFWRQPVGDRPNSYYAESLGLREARIREFALFRREGEEIAFLHDSFLYFYEALSLREHRGPGEPPRSERLGRRWCREALSRIIKNPAAWQNAMEFLGGLLDHSGDVESILMEFLLVDPVPVNWIDLLQSLSRGAAACSEIAAAIHRMTVLDGSHIRSVPEQLAVQAYARIYECVDGSTAIFAERLLSRLSQRGASWLRLLSGTVSHRDVVMFGHRGGVTALRTLADGRLASASLDNTIRIWDPETGRSEVIAERQIEVKSLIALPNGRLANDSEDGEDGTVRIWNLLSCPPVIVAEHAGPASALAVLDDGCLAIGSFYGWVRVWDPDSGRSEVIVEGAARVNAISVLEDGRLAIGSDDGIVRVQDPATGRYEVVTEYDQPVRALAALAGSRLAIAVGDGTVRVWDPGSGRSDLLAEYDRSVSALAALAGNRLAITVGDGTVRVWDLETGGSEVVAEHIRGVSTLAVFDDGRLAFGSLHGSLRVRDPDTERPGVVSEHTDAVTALAALEGGRLASGSQDGSVRVRDPATGRSEVVAEHNHSVSALAALEGGRLALLNAW